MKKWGGDPAEEGLGVSQSWGGGGGCEGAPIPGQGSPGFLWEAHWDHSGRHGSTETGEPQEPRPSCEPSHPV